MTLYLNNGHFCARYFVEDSVMPIKFTGREKRKAAAQGGGQAAEQQAQPQQKPKKSNAGLLRICAFIVDKRMLFFLLYIIWIIFSVFSSSWVKVDNKLSDYLPDSTETKRGLKLMDKEFTTFGSAKIMIANISFDDAKTLQGIIEEKDGVQSVTFTDVDADTSDFKKYYNNGSALFNVTFDYDEDDDRALTALEDVETALSDYNIYVDTDMGDQSAEIIETEISKIMVLVAIVVVTVLIITSESFGEIPVFCMTFVVSMVINQGTNFLFGTISFVSNSVSAILQLALSVDYAIIFCNRFKEEKRNGYDPRDAAIVSLSKSIPEILSSSLTTISGLFAMVFMQYQIGKDLGIVLIKAILLSLLAVFTLMPGLLVIFSGLMERTQHKSFVPKISGIGHFAFHTRKIIPFVFFFFFVAAAVLSQKCPYVYGYSTLTTPIQNSTQIADKMIEDNFGSDNLIALILPHGSYENEAKLIQDLEACDEVDHCQGLANTTAMDDYTLTDTLNPRQFSELMNMDYEICETLYTAYAADQEDYGRIVGGISSYKVSLMDMVGFVHDMVEDGYVTLDDDLWNTLDSAYTQIQDGRKQLESSDYDRILVYLTLPEESDETFTFLDTMHTMAEKYYPDDADKILTVGNSTSERDLKSSFERDNIVVSVVSILFVLVILLFTFKSAGLPVLQIMVIEGSIFLNFSYPTITKSNLFFMSYLIVSSIQMGANIDYAIVISSRYQELRGDGKDRKTAITESLNFAFPTIITSGSMMILAGVFIGQMTSEPCIASIGQCLGRGTAISVFLVMFVLPQLLCAGDKIIQYTAFDIDRPIRQKKETGLVYLNGNIRGTINGTIVGQVHAVVRGDVQAIVVSGSMERAEGSSDYGPDADPSRMIEGHLAGESGQEKGKTSAPGNPPDAQDRKPEAASDAEKKEHTPGDQEEKGGSQ